MPITDFNLLVSSSINADAGNTLTLKGAMADGASAIGTVVGSSVTLANSTAKLLSVVNNVTEKLFVGPELFYCGLPDRETVFTCAYTDRKASYLKRFKFGGTILNKAYLCIPDKSRILFFEPGTPAELYIRYKPAPYQKINQQTCNPTEVEVKSPKTRGRQISIKDVSSINSEPSRGWDPEAATTKLQFV